MDYSAMKRGFVVIVLALRLFAFVSGLRGETPAPSGATQDLLAAAKAGDLGGVSDAMKRGANLNGRGRAGLRPLHFAAFRGDAQIVALLLDGGANANERDDLGMTPLHAAAFEGKKEVVLLLLRRGADPAAEDSSGYTPLNYARTNGKADVVAALQAPPRAAAGAPPRRADAPTPSAGVTTPGARTPLSPATLQLFTAVRTADMNTASEAIRRGADVNAPGPGGMRPLHFAAFKGNPALTEFLLDEGAQVDGRDDLGMTPLNAAAFEGRTEVAALLLRRGANPLAADSSGRTPLDYSLANGKTDVAALLQAQPGVAPVKAPPRPITDEEIAGAGSGIGKGFAVGDSIPPPAKLASPEVGAYTMDAAEYRPSKPCAQTLRDLRERRKQILAKRSNYDVVDKAEVRAEIEDEETNFNPTDEHSVSYSPTFDGDGRVTGSVANYSTVPGRKARLTKEHDAKLAKLRAKEAQDKVLSDETQAEVAQIDAKIADLQKTCY